MFKWKLLVGRVFTGESLLAYNLNLFFSGEILIFIDPGCRKESSDDILHYIGESYSHIGSLIRS